MPGAFPAWLRDVLDALANNADPSKQSLAVMLVMGAE